MGTCVFRIRKERRTGSIWRKACLFLVPEDWPWV
jgi:hypothetical protein